MKYTYEGKTYNVPDKDIDSIMEKTDISIAEACEMWLFDHDKIGNDEVEQLTKTATKNRVTATIHKAKAETKEKKVREKKENPVKRQIIGLIYNLFVTEYQDIAKISLTNPEKIIDITIGDREFTINLVEHRKKKE